MNRWTARELVTFNPDLSHGAARLYEALDQYARDSGICWPKQSTLAARVGCSVRSLRYYLSELVTAGLVEVERISSGGQNRYALYHRQQVAAPQATDCRTHRQQVASHIRNNQDNETELPPLSPQRGERAMKCWVCRGRGQRPGAIRGTCPGCGGSGLMEAAS